MHFWKPNTCKLSDDAIKQGVGIQNVPLDPICSLPSLLVRDALLEEVIQRGSETDEIITRHGKSARRADLVNIDKNDRPRAGDYGDFLLRDDFVECGCAVFENIAWGKMKIKGVNAASFREFEST